MMSAFNLSIVGSILIIFSSYGGNSLPCDKIPDGVRKQKNINDIDRYIIVIHGNPKSYTPNQRYNEFDAEFSRVIDDEQIHSSSNDILPSVPSISTSTLSHPESTKSKKVVIGYVSLQVNPNAPTQKAFKRFMLTLESEKDSTTSNLYHSSGQFEFEYGSAVLTKFSERCPNTVIENGKLPKSEIQALEG